MAAAVLLRAVEDAQAEIKPNKLIYDKKSRRHKSVPQGDVTQREKEEAIIFLTSMSPDWRESRNLWSLLADVDPDRIRRRVRDGTVLPIVR